jgi:hypothetical protein
MNKNKKIEHKKIISSFVMLSLLLTGFASLFIVNEPAVSAAGTSTTAEPLIRIYGENDAVYPTQSYYGANDFVYPEEFDPFDPGIIEKDSITFNPAFLYGHEEYEIQAQGDASEKIFLRAFYEPGYTHPVDQLMDDWSDVSLHSVETFDAIVTETTYFLVDLIGNEPTVGYPGETKIALPYQSTDPDTPGMEEMGLLDVTYAWTNDIECPSKIDNGWLTDGGIAVEKTFEFNNIDYSQDIVVNFFDHKVTIKNFENGDDNTFDKLDLEVSYIGNMYDAASQPLTHTIWEDSWGPGFYYFFDRANDKQPWTDPAHRWFLYIENADDDYLRMKLGRVLYSGETFYVDGVRYDIPAVYVTDDYGFKYITFQSPIPKGEPIWDNVLYKNVDDFSHVTSQYLASLPVGTPVWVLPPFNMEHWMIDDIGLYKYSDDGCFKVPRAGMILEDKKDALEFYYVDETIEPRFDTSLTERLDTNENGVESWQWYNVYTLPNRYTEFVLPNQEIPCEQYYYELYPSWYPSYIDADGAEYLITSSLIAPNSNVDLDRTNSCKGMYEHEIYDRVSEIALCGERSFYWGMPRFVYEFDAYNPIDFYVNEGTNEPSVKIYGEDIDYYCKDPIYPTQSGSGAEDYIYEDESDPFDPSVIEKDSITFNPAFIDGHGGQYEIQAQGDASEKVFLRAFYEPGYTHPVDQLMDDWSDVSLYPVETFDAIVTETTYFLVDITDRTPTVGYPDQTKIVLPYQSTDPDTPGMEEMDLLDVVGTSGMDSRPLTDGSIMVEKEIEVIGDEFIGQSFRFMDHMVTIVNFEDSDDYSFDKLDIKASYIGNMNDAISSTQTYTIWQNEWGPEFRYFFDRQNNMQLCGSDPAHRWYLYIENADDDYLRMKLGRCLAAGETFYVDGVRYDMPAVYVDGDGGFKYITLQSPIPKGEPVWRLPLYKNVDDFSHVTSQYLASLPEGMPVWVLPPFNDDHQMIDDIGLQKYESTCGVKVPVGGMLLRDLKDALEFYYIDETYEPRFDTSLTERLDTNENGVESWLWYNVYTLPNRYTEFVLPNQEVANEYYESIDYPNWYPTYIKADGAEYLITSSLIAPNSNVDTDRTDVCKTFDEHEIFNMICEVDRSTESTPCQPVPRYVFEFDAYDGTGFFLNENGYTDPVYYDPTADAGGPYSGGIEEQICFDATASHDNDENNTSIVQYDWKFYAADSWHIDLGPNPCHTYSAAQTYTVTVRVTDDEGATDTDTATVHIAETPSTDSWIIIEDVCIPEDGTEYTYLKATGITEDVGSCEVTLSWDPTVASIVELDHSDFESLYYYINEADGTINIVASNTNVALSGDFDIARIKFQAVGALDDHCTATIQSSLILTDDPVPAEVAHDTMNGLIYIGNCDDPDPPVDDGDMNGDGKVNSADVRYLALYLAGDPLYSVLHSDGNVNSDSSVNSGDVRYLALYLAGDPAYDPLYP